MFLVYIYLVGPVTITASQNQGMFIAGQVVNDEDTMERLWRQKYRLQ
jgi:hypothetical protein